MWAIARRSAGTTRGSRVVLIAVVALAAGFLQFGLTGARRTSSAFPRLSEWTRPATVFLGGAPEGIGPIRNVLADVEALPSVVAHARYESVLTHGVEIDGRLIQQPRLRVTAVGERSTGAGGRVKVLDGSLPPMSSTDQAVVDMQTADALSLAVGEPMTLVLQDGTRFDVRLAAIVANSTTFPSVGGFVTPSIVLPPGFTEAHSDWTDPWEITDELWLRDGVDGIDTWTREMQALGLGDIDFGVAAVVESGSAKVFRLQSLGLELAALVAGATSLAVISQLLARQRQRAASDLLVLSELGLTRRGAVLSLALGDLCLAGIACLLAVAASVAASPLTPFGMARRAEIDPGVWVDWTVIASVTAATLMSVVAIGTACTLSATRLTAGHDARRASFTSRVARGLPEPLGTGWRIAFGGGRIASSSVLAPTVTVLVAVGVAANVASLSGVAERPELSGGSWGAFVAVHDDAAAERLEQMFLSEPTVTGVARGGWSTLMIGDDAVLTQVLEPGAGLESSIVNGREPSGPNDIALGSTLLDRLGVDVGSTVEIAVSEGSGTASFDVVGEVVQASPLFQSIEPGAGAQVSDQAYERWFADGPLALLLEFDPSVTPQIGLESVLADVPDGLATFAFARSNRGDVLAVGSMVAVPWILAGFLAVLTLASLAQWSTQSSRRELRRSAVLMALGSTNADVRRAFLVAGLAVAGVSLAIGTALGVLVGGQVWHRMAAWLVVVPRVDVPVALCVTAGAVTVALMSTLATIAARPHLGSPARRLRME